MGSVVAPFDDVKGIYDSLGQALGPLGLELDYEQIKMTRPQIAERLRPRTEDLKAVEYTPLPGGDWKVSTPAEQGLDPLHGAELYLEATGLSTLYGLLVIKNDHLPLIVGYPLISDPGTEFHYRNHRQLVFEDAKKSVSDSIIYNRGRL